MNRYQVLGLASLLLLAVPAHAEPSWGLYWSGLTLSDDRPIGIGRSATGITVEGSFSPGKQDWLSIGGGGSFIEFEDFLGFTQTVVSTEGGFPRTASSGERGGSFFAFAQAEPKLGSRSGMGLRLGYESFSFTREIGNCIDCRAESVDIEGGAFTAANVWVRVAKRLKLKASYRAYLEGDFEKQILFGLGF